MNRYESDELSILPSIRVFSTAILGSLVLSFSFFWLVSPDNMGAQKFMRSALAEYWFWYVFVFWVCAISGVLSIAKRCGLIEIKDQPSGKFIGVRPPKFSMKYRIKMLFRNCLVELVLGVVLIVLGSIQLSTYEPWPDSLPVQPVFPFGAIYWVLISCGVGLILYAYLTADKD